MHHLAERSEQIRKGCFALDRSRKGEAAIEALARVGPSPLAGTILDSRSRGLRRVLLPDSRGDPLE
jgi:hypothetical protein